MSVKTSLGALAAFALAAVATAAKAEVPSCVAIDGIERVTVAVDGVARLFLQVRRSLLRSARRSRDLVGRRQAKGCGKEGSELLAGGLATISDAAEDEAVFKMAVAEQTLGFSHSGLDRRRAEGLHRSRSGKCGWVMLDGQEIPPENNLDAESFANWRPGQPDDGDGTENGAENHLAIGKFPGWTDERPRQRLRLDRRVRRRGVRRPRRIVSARFVTRRAYCAPSSRSRIPKSPATASARRRSTESPTRVSTRPPGHATSTRRHWSWISSPRSRHRRHRPAPPVRVCSADAPAGTPAEFILIRFKTPEA